MFAKPQAEHAWLTHFVGNWTYENTCQMPDGKSIQSSGTSTCRLLGGIWLICESTGEGPEGESYTTITTVGFDSTQNKYVGTFVGSMMAHIWHYVGELEQGKRLPLLTEGPKLNGSGRCNYHDIFEAIDQDTWILRSEYQDDDGQWVPFMVSKHTRALT